MKTLTLSSVIMLAVFLACGGNGNPGDAVIEMFEAIQAGNGERAVSFMSSSALDEMEIQLETIKLDPEMSAQQLSSMGIELDADEIPDMTAKDFMIAMISSPMITGMMQSAEITVGEVTIDGDIAQVEVTSSIMDQTETNIIDVVLEEGKWKVTEFDL
ncbi:MAG: hypothetical protein K8R76_12965 [Candidatus Aegiribacteria sp.]|nr:hypothetical protein [Candidatus Aegiribacteria sp.]